ncbi:MULTISPECIES: flagellin [Hyphobacterium]|uniref:Flagellin n=1 Tax=Hyphobacterium vulgare TaxID=1736751 RepID=A0ABV6ZZQ2_9PROT
MTRIATSAAAQSALADLMRAQRSVYEAQQQIATGKVGDNLRGVGHRAETLSAAYGAQLRAGAYEEAAKRTANRLEVTDAALGLLAESATELRLAMTTTDGTYIMDQVREAFDSARNALSTQYAGAYIFGGTRADADPITANSLSDLIAAPAAGDVFQNSARKNTVKLDDNLTMETGILASDVGTDLMASFKRIAEFNAGADGPFDGPLTQNQQAFIQAEMQNILAAYDRINDHVGENGAMQNRVEGLVTSQQNKADYLDRLIGSIEDVDMAEAATRFQQAQTAVDVSARTFATLSQVSLLPFLR